MIGVVILIIILLFAWYGYWALLGVLAISTVVIPAGVAAGVVSARSFDCNFNYIGCPTAEPSTPAVTSTAATDTSAVMTPAAAKETLAGTPGISRAVINSVFQQTPGAAGVDLYVYHGKYVLLVTVVCCNNTAQLYDIQGKSLGSPFVSNASDWHSNAKYTRHLFGRNA